MRLDGTWKGARQDTDAQRKTEEGETRRGKGPDRTGHRNKQVERDGTRHGETRNGTRGAGQDGTRRGKERKETWYASGRAAKRNGTGHKNQQIQRDAERAEHGMGEERINEEVGRDGKTK
jgi:hypothetical protein